MSVSLNIGVVRICFSTACNFELVEINYLIIRSSTFNFDIGHYLQ